jgi:hypothetical protein
MTALRHLTSTPIGIAIFGDDLFVVSAVKGTVGEYTTSGGMVNASLISGLVAPHGIAIGPVPEPSSGALAGLGAVAFWLRFRRK